MLKISSRMKPGLLQCLSLVPIRETEQVPAQGPSQPWSHMTVGEKQDREPGGGESLLCLCRQTQTPNGQCLQLSLCPVPRALCRGFCIFCHLGSSPHIPGYTFFYPESTSTFLWIVNN